MKARTEPYGAEALEHKYPVYVFASLSITVVMVVMVFLYPIIRDAMRKPSDEKLHVKVTRVIDYSELSAPPPIELEKLVPEPLTAPPESKVVKFLPPVVKKDEEVNDENMLPTLDEMRNAQVGTENIEGVDSVFISQNDNLHVKTAPEPEKAYEPFTFVEVMPEFQGGPDALYSYLAANMAYPTVAKEAGIQGTVYISFIVEVDGRITHLEVVRSVHALLDGEALRVVKDMPSWKPGKQNQTPVRVRFTLPITFKLK